MIIIIEFSVLGNNTLTMCKDDIKTSYIKILVSIMALLLCTALKQIIKINEYTVQKSIFIIILCRDVKASISFQPASQMCSERLTDLHT